MSNTIFRSLLEEIPSLLASYEATITNVDEVVQELRDRLIADGTIQNLSEISADEAQSMSLCAIDGASAKEQLQTADILAAGATLSEGYYNRRIKQEELAQDSYVKLLMHDSKNSAILDGMRAYTEISVLGATNHKLPIIDGSYLGNVLTVVYLLQDSKVLALEVLKKMSSDPNDSFIKGLKKIFTSQVDNEQYWVSALAKSDSSKELVNTYAPNAEHFSTDKIFAQRLLKSGEFIKPLNVKANISRASLLQWDQETNKWKGFRMWNPSNDLSADEFTLLSRVFSLDTNNPEELFNHYTYLYEMNLYFFTYFKPIKFSDSGHALRLEFKIMDGEIANTRGIETAQYISKDAYSIVMKEPYSQYIVDRVAKENVSTALTYIVSKLSRASKDLGLASSYRT